MKLKQIVYIFIISIILILAGTTNSHASLYLNNIEFKAYLKENGDMDVTEILYLKHLIVQNLVKLVM